MMTREHLLSSGKVAYVMHPVPVHFACVWTKIFLRTQPHLRQVPRLFVRSSVIEGCKRLTMRIVCLGSPALVDTSYLFTLFSFKIAESLPDSLLPR